MISKLFPCKQCRWLHVRENSYVWPSAQSKGIRGICPICPHSNNASVLCQATDGRRQSMLYFSNSRAAALTACP